VMALRYETMKQISLVEREQYPLPCQHIDA
jgi:hypothetical protein